MIYTPLIWPLLIAILINAAVAAYARRYWGRAGAFQLSLLLWLGVIVAALYTLEISLSALAVKIFLSEARLAILAFIPAGILALTLAYLGYTDRLSRTHWLALLSIPALIALLSLTGAHHQLFRYNFQLTGGGTPFLVFQRGVFWYIYYAYSLLVAAAIGSLLIQQWTRLPPACKKSPAAMTPLLVMAALLLPLLVDNLYVLGLTPVHGFYWTPAIFSISGCLLAWTLLRGRLFDFAPIARAKVLENITDLVIVLDLDNRIVDFNQAAQAACGLSKAALGCLPEQALGAQWAAILRSAGQADSLPTSQPDEAPAGSSWRLREPVETQNLASLREPEIHKREVRIRLPRWADAGADAPAQEKVYELTRSVIQDRRQRERSGLRKLSRRGGRRDGLPDGRPPVLGTLYLLHDITWVKQAEEEIRSLAKFPGENPFPVLRADPQGMARYANRPGQELLGSWGKTTGSRLPEAVCASLQTAWSNGTVERLEYESGEQTFEFVLKPVAEGGYINLYGRDISEQKAMEGALRLARDELEQRVVERTAELVEANRKLKLEIDERMQAEESLRLSENQLSNAAKIARLGYWEYDVAQDLFTFNDQFYTMLRSTAEQVGGYRMSAAEYTRHFVHPDEGAIVAIETQAAIETTDPGFNRQVEHRILYGDGEIGHIVVRFFVVKDSQGRTIKTFGVNQDISERKQAEQALRDSQANLSALIENTGDSIWSVDSDYRLMAGNTVFRNNFRNVVGTEPQEGDSILHSNLAAEIKERWRQFYQRALDGEAFIVEAPTQFQPAQRIREYRIHPIRNLDGSVTGVTVAGRDITERKLAEETLRQANLYNRSLIETSLDPLVTIGADGKITDVNSATEQITGLNRQELTGTDFSAYFTDPGRASAGYRKVFHEGSVRDYELELKHRDGKLTPVLYNASLYRDETGQVRGVFAAARDITRRKQIEQAEREQRHLAEALRDSAVALTSSLDLDQVLDQIIASVELVAPAESVAILLVDSREPGNKQVKIARQRGRVLVEPGRPPHDLSFTLEGNRSLQWMAETGKSLAIADVRNCPGWIEYPGEGWIRSNVGAPICIQGETVGFIDLNSARPGFFNDVHAKTLEAFAAQAAIAIENAKLYEEMQAARERLLTISIRLVQVQESERRHLARELHDEIGQALTGLKLSLEVGTGQLHATASQPSELRTRLRQAGLQVSELIAKTRELSLALRPAMLDDLGLLPALIWQLDRYTEQTGIRVQFQASDLEGRRFSPEVETAAYRIVQEALTNVARHARVKQAAVHIWVEAAVGGSGAVNGIGDPVYRLHVGVEDRGVGFDLPAELASRKAGGLAGMQERVTLLGGRLTIAASRATGTRLTAVFPI